MRVTRFIGAAVVALASTFSLFAHADEASDKAIRKTLENAQPGNPGRKHLQQPAAMVCTRSISKAAVCSMPAPMVNSSCRATCIQIQDGKPVNLTEKSRTPGQSRKLINEHSGRPRWSFIPAIGETKSHITVFTDTTCPYCHKLHEEVPELNKRGIEVRYVAFPRQGLGSPGDEQLQAVWCSKDRRKLPWTAWSTARNIKAAKVRQPGFTRQFEIGQSIGVNGTPAIVLADGQLIPGYQPAPQVAKLALSAK
jgi:thiol:disulfide interchange protein DsbC